VKNIMPGENDLKVIQGVVARGYRMPRVGHFVLQVKEPVAARRFLYGLVQTQRITTAEEWKKDANGVTIVPEECLNIGFTFNGLQALGLVNECQGLADRAVMEGSELEPFVQGAVKRAPRIGDTGASAPERWIGGLEESDRVHVLLSLYGRTDAIYRDRKLDLTNLCTAQGAFDVVSVQEGSALNASCDLVHFGFRDGFAQPNVEGLPAHKDNKDGGQPTSPAGAFVLGYPSQFLGHTYHYDFPRELGKNGSFAAFRVLEQDVAGFERYLKTESKYLGLTPDELAARLCGRSREGKPLVSPDTINDFNYSTDPKGVTCPFGAHIRRANPRDDRIAGGSASKRRIIRRGAPYGPPYDPKYPDDGIPRGLLGLFICGNLRDQFEFIMRNWLNRGGFQGKLPAHDADGMTGVKNFVTTRGSIYCFYPSIEGLSYIAHHV
jgi:deferrochelatase/peroxidase EfeB